MCIFYMIAWVRSFTLVNVLIAWATIVFAVLAIIFKKISDLFKRLSSRPIILDGSQQENSGGRKNILSFLQDIIIDWDAFSRL